MFRDRADAAAQLAGKLASRYLGAADTVVYGIPRGGVVVAARIAHELGLPIDVVVASKIGAPGNPEYAIGAVDPDGAVTPNVYAGYSLPELEHLGRSAREKVEQRLDLYRGWAGGIHQVAKTAILVDDGIATGLTALAAIDYLRRHGARRVVLATPVVSEDTAEVMSAAADELQAVETPEIFYAVGQFYERFEQVTDEEVMGAIRGVGHQA